VPRISEESIQRVAEANDIVEVIGSYFPLKRAGTSWRALCPFHREKSPSFHVNPQRQSYHCFGCGAGGSVFKFVMEYEHLDFPSAVRRLAQRAGVPIVEEAGSAEDDRRHDQRKRLITLHADAAGWFHQHLLRNPAAQAARDYLKSRAINLEIAKSWQLGYAPDSWDALILFLREKRYSEEDIVESGLVSTKEDEQAGGGPAHHYARFRDRVMFPIRNDYGEVIAFSGRVLDANARTAKYVNSPETPIFTKGRVLYGLDKSKRALIEADAAIVCEGQLDLISAYEAGIQNVIAPQGTAFTQDQARVLQRFVKKVILCFDSDRAGQEAVSRSLPALLERDLDVRVAALPEGEDPDSMIRTQGPDAFRAAIAQARDFFDHALAILAERGALNDPAGKAGAARRLGPYVAMINDPVLRETTAKRICARLGVAEAAFATHIKKTAPAAPTEEQASPPAAEPITLDEGIRQLCRYAILAPEAREWLRQAAPPAPAQLGTGGEFLQRLLSSDLALQEPGARAVLASSLSPAEEAVFNSLDLERAPAEILPLTRETWHGLAAFSVDARIAATKSEISQPSLSSDDELRLQSSLIEMTKLKLDLKKRLNEA